MNRISFAASVLTAGLCVAVGCGSPNRSFGSGAGAGGDSGSAGDDAVSGGRSGAGGGAGGSLADAGEGGETAAAGRTDEPMSCKKSTDCDDGKACNGDETCSDGTCKPGTSPCENVDSVNCEVQCSEAASKAVCGAPRGVDADKDGHRSAACKAQPGDDCDDGNKNVYPGATEICDGVDNDCNGKADIADGLTLSGTTEVLWSSSKSSSIAYSPTENVYGVALSRATGAAGEAPFNGALFVIDSKNKPTITAVPLTTSTTGYAGATAITWGGTEFGIAYGNESDVVRFRRVGADGASHPDIEVSALTSQLVSLSIARVPNGNWGIVWNEAFQSYHGVRGRTVSSTDTPSGEFPFGTAGIRPQIVSLDQAFGVSWYELSPGTGSSVSLDNRSATFSSTKAQTLSTGTAATKAVIASKAKLFGVAWLDGANVVFRTMTDAGAAGCAPVTIAADGFVPSDIVSTKNGFLIASGAAKIEVLEVSDACVFGQRLTVDPDTAQNLHLAGGAAGFALAWDDATFGKDLKGVQTRTFGPNYCD